VTPTAAPAADLTVPSSGGLAVAARSPRALLSALTGMSGDDRADVVLAMQRTVGNRAVGNVLQRNPAKTKAKAKPVYVPYQIHVDRQMTQEQFRVAAMTQIFGKVRMGIKWEGGQATYDVAGSPYPVNVESGLVREQRTKASEERGVAVDEGRISGAKARAEEFWDEPGSDEKSALLNEIDRRYFAATGDRTNSKIQAGEPGKAELWRAIRDEVLFQHEYLGNLPDNIKRAIEASIRGRTLTMADYDRLFTIAKKIEKLPPGQAFDYTSKLTSSTTDLDVFERMLDTYSAEMAERAKQGEERDKLQTKLAGMDEFYKRYRTMKDLLKSGAMASGAAMSGYPGAGGVGLVVGNKGIEVYNELSKEVKRYGFADLTAFEKWVKDYEKAFERESVNIAQDVLKRFSGKLFKESQRYSDPAEVAALHQKLAGVRAQYQTFEANVQFMKDAAVGRKTDANRLPGQGHVPPKTRQADVEAARKRAEAAKAAAQAEVKGLAGEYPIFQEDGLPEGKRVNKEALAKADATTLAGVLQGHIQARMGDVKEASDNIADKPELIYKMDKLMPQFYAQQGIRSGSVHDMIIQDKMRSDAILKMVKGIALAIVAIALAVVTFGTATPAIIAAGAAIGGATIGIYSALDEYEEYTKQKSLADVGLAKDPSVVWLVVALVGAGLDVTSVAGAMKALIAPAKLLNTAGDVAAFHKAVDEALKLGEIEATAARAAKRAADARKGLSEAWGGLKQVTLGKAYGFPGPLADPEVYIAVVKLAREAVKTGIYTVDKFIAELRAARATTALGDLTPEEIVKAREAWEAAKAAEAAEAARQGRLAMQVPDATKLDEMVRLAGDSEKLERLLKVFPPDELEQILTRVYNSAHIPQMLDAVGPETTAKTIRMWMRDREFGKMENFLVGLASREGKELAETTGLTAKSVVVDSNTAISLERRTQGLKLNEAQQSRVDFVDSLPAGTEIRVGNATFGELGSDTLKVKGVPITGARDSAEYKEVVQALENVKIRTGPKTQVGTRLPVGGEEGHLDRALVADQFFAKADPGVAASFVTSDGAVVRSMVNFADAEALKLYAAKGFDALVAKYSKIGGFKATIKLADGTERSIMVIPVP
jgi:hypothetical protein